ncbi:hypothetical protein PJI16_18860 [Nitrospira sp. MA-1]|nr:hypothetical protein [Nitrospira sp. MA-1]
MGEIDWTSLGIFLPIAFLALALSLMAFLALALSIMPPSLALGETGQQAQIGRELLVPREQIILGTVQQAMSNVIQVTIGHPEPLFLSLRAEAEKGFQSMQRGDKLTIVISDKNQYVDFHKADYPEGSRALKGHLLQPLMGNCKWVVIQTESGINQTYEVDENTRHTVMNIPVRMPAVFHFNMDNMLIDATFENEEMLLQDPGPMIHETAPNA